MGDRTLRPEPRRLARRELTPRPRHFAHATARPVRIMRTMLSLRRSAAAPLAAAVLLLAAACSSGDGTAADGDASAQQNRSTPVAPRTGPPPTVDPAVLASPEVRAIEAWAAAYARAVNQRDHAFTAAADPAAPEVRVWMERHAGPEWGRYFPGPLPVAPLGVRPDDATHRVVEACVQVSGWSQQDRSVRRTRSREVVGMSFRMTSTAGRWRVDRITSAGVDCRGVVLRARTW